MQQKLKIELRQKQLYRNNDLEQPITVSCDDVCFPTYADGFVPDNNFHDFTDQTEGLDDFSISWSAISSDNTSSMSQSGTNEIGSNYSRGVSVDLRFRDDAFRFIYDWMMINPCQILNSIEVKITDLDCDKEYRLFEIKTDNLNYAPIDEPCIVSVALREADAAAKAVETTIIEDDWQGWFNSDGTSAKDHPTFIYVVEKKPQFILVILMAVAYLAGILSTGILTTLDVGKRWIRKMLGISYFCPSPYILTYIENFCSKYGFTHNTIFDSGEYSKVCLFFCLDQYYQNHDDYDSPSTKFIWNNRTGMPMNVFLDQLKLVFNAEWYITPNNELVFQRKDYFQNLTPIYDFSYTGAQPLYNFKYSFNGDKKPSYADYEYRIDPQDTCSNDLKWRYNTIVDFDGLAYNPMLEGSLQKNFDFACTSFVYDGATEDFIKNSITDGRLIAELAILVGLIALFATSDPLTAVITAAILTAAYLVTNSFINDFFHKEEIEGAVRVSSNVINIPRLLFKDNDSPNNRSKVISVETPTVNTFYNPTSDDYYTKHPAFNAPAGYFGSDVTKIYNYPMYVDEDFEDNLFDNFQQLDNPLRNPIINQNWQADIDMCCSMMDIFGLWEDSNIEIGAVVVIENRNGRIIKGRIQDIKINYKTGMIHLEGNVLGCTF